MCCTKSLLSTVDSKVAKAVTPLRSRQLFRFATFMRVTAHLRKLLTKTIWESANPWHNYTQIPLPDVVILSAFEDASAYSKSKYGQCNRIIVVGNNSLC